MCACTAERNGLSSCPNILLCCKQRHHSSTCGQNQYNWVLIQLAWVPVTVKPGRICLFESHYVAKCDFRHCARSKTSFLMSLFCNYSFQSRVDMTKTRKVKSWIVTSIWFAWTWLEICITLFLQKNPYHCHSSTDLCHCYPFSLSEAH